MGIDNGPSSIERDLEKFAADLSDAGEFAKEFGARTPLQDLPSFEDLTGHEAEIMATLAHHYDVDFTNPRVIKEYSIRGTDGSPGEGEIKVRVIGDK